MAAPTSILCLHQLQPDLQKVITDINPAIKLTIIDPKDIHAINEAHSDTNIILAWGQQNIDPYLQFLPNLRWIQTFTAGVDQILSPMVADKKIIVTNTRGIHGIPISEYIFANLLSYYRKLPKLQEMQKNKQWAKVTGNEIFDKTIGIVGLGSIGREIAKRAKAFGLEVLANKKQHTDELFIDKLYTDRELETMLPKCDIVVLSLPLTPETKYSFDYNKFKLMKKNACLINISRGSVLVESDLIRALQEKEFEHAILDVFEEEPLPPTSPLWEIPNITLTPHISASTPYYMERAIHLFAENIKQFIQDKSLVNIIDPQKGY